MLKVKRGSSKSFGFIFWGPLMSKNVMSTHLIVVKIGLLVLFVIHLSNCCGYWLCDFIFGVWSCLVMFGYYQTVFVCCFALLKTGKKWNCMMSENVKNVNKKRDRPIVRQSEHTANMGKKWLIVHNFCDESRISLYIKTDWKLFFLVVFFHSALRNPFSRSAPLPSTA